ncbi:hypothetical protein [Erythrobacter sp. THAF29]|uniref:glucosamine inositolphosphorylceramide transferase family protein n=1 Tax=Erythrobacter sp. THAF29 TaxID=2587851 RepID=UPI00126847BF|nr:hypothetical protein [Erythrobacter sp. THAF29]QFT77346.1 hypothetical protein FIU90_07300 [Erythrobacter sp. THAF29]
MPTDTDTGRPLSIAILAGSDQVFEPWEASLFERLMHSADFSLETFLISDHSGPRQKPSRVYRALLDLEERLFTRGNRQGIPITDDRFADIPKIAPQAIGVDGQIDIVLSHIPGMDCSSISERCDEVWEYHFNVSGPDMVGTFGFRECLEARPITKSGIIAHRAGGSRGLLAVSKSNTKISATFNAEYAKAVLSSLVEKELRRTARQPDRGAAFVPPSLDNAPIPLRSPTPLECLRYSFGLGTRIARRGADSLLKKIGAQPENWSLVLGEGEVLGSSLERLTELKQPKGEFRADPFLFETEDERWVFFESYNYRTKLGSICVGRIEGDTLIDVTPLDFGDVHCSYPFVFEHDGEIFLIPETHERERIEVWRCADFPHRWELHATGLEGESAADTVFVEWNDECWLFTNLSRHDFVDHCAELHVFKVSGPDLANIEPHPLNPVVVDSTRARNGGRPFVSEGRLIRPGQITSHGSYGYGLALLEVTELSMDTYAEREIRRIEPEVEQSTIGCHHVDHSSGVFIMDARRAYGSKLLGARPIAVRAT